MDIEELEPQKKKPEPKNLEAMGVEELEEYQAELEAGAGPSSRASRATWPAPRPSSRAKGSSENK